MDDRLQGELSSLFAQIDRVMASLGPPEQAHGGHHCIVFRAATEGQRPRRTAALLFDVPAEATTSKLRTGGDEAAFLQGGEVPLGRIWGG